jgi:hypothetical protein
MIWSLVVLAGPAVAGPAIMAFLVWRAARAIVIRKHLDEALRERG